MEAKYDFHRRADGNNDLDSKSFSTTRLLLKIKHSGYSLEVTIESLVGKDSFPHGGVIKVGCRLLHWVRYKLIPFLEQEIAYSETSGHWDIEVQVGAWIE